MNHRTRQVIRMKNRKIAKKGTAWRLIRTVFEFYPVMMPAVLVCVVINAVVSSIPAVFQQNIIALMEKSWQTGDWGAVSGTITRWVLTLLILYLISLIASFSFNRMMATVTQGSLMKFREKMFDKM